MHPVCNEGKLLKMTHSEKVELRICLAMSDKIKPEDKLAFELVYKILSSSLSSILASAQLSPSSPVFWAFPIRLSATRKTFSSSEAYPPAPTRFHNMISLLGMCQLPLQSQSSHYCESRASSYKSSIARCRKINGQNPARASPLFLHTQETCLFFS